MAMMFALRYRDIDKTLPVAEIKTQWPVLFSLKAVCSTVVFICVTEICDEFPALQSLFLCWMMMNE